MAAIAGALHNDRAATLTALDVGCRVMVAAMGRSYNCTVERPGGCGRNGATQNSAPWATGAKLRRCCAHGPWARNAVRW